MGEGVVASLKMVRGRAQFRWFDTFMVIQECGPEALGIVALINFLIGMILAFIGATELTQFGASIYTADLVAITSVREMACIMDRHHHLRTHRGRVCRATGHHEGQPGD